MSRTVVKAKVGDLEEDIREGCLRRSSKEITGVVQEVVRKSIYFVSFQDGDISPLWSSIVK